MSTTKSPLANGGKPGKTAPTVGSGEPDTSNLFGGGNTPPALPGSTSGDATSWTAASKASFDTTGLGIPGLTGPQTGAQIFAAIESAATTNSDKGALWGSLRPLVAVGQGYTKKDSSVSWSSKDVTAVKDYIARINNYNTVHPNAPVSIAGYMSLDKQSLQTSGTSLSLTANTLTTTPNVIPASADLASAAQQAFATTLGRSASPSEVADFTKKYQALVASYGTAKDMAKASMPFNAPSTPIQFEGGAQAGSTPAPISSTTSGVNNVISPPTAAIAASNYAAEQNPTEASAQAASDGLNQFMSMLKGA